MALRQPHKKTPPQIRKALVDVGNTNARGSAPKKSKQFEVCTNWGLSQIIGFRRFRETFSKSAKIRDPRSPTPAPPKSAAGSFNSDAVEPLKSPVNTAHNRVQIRLQYIVTRQTLCATILDVQVDDPSVKLSTITGKIGIMSSVVQMSKINISHTKLMSKSTSKPYEFLVPASRLESDVLRLELLKDGVSTFAEVFIQLRNFKGAKGSADIQWFPLQSLQQQRQNSWGKGRKRSNSTGSIRSLRQVDIGPFEAWLQETFSQLEVNPEMKDLIDCKNRPRPDTSLFRTPSSALNQKESSLWEIFTSECSHLAALDCLCELFLRLLRLTVSSNDVRTKPLSPKAVHVDRIFMNVEMLHNLSFRLATDLRAALDTTEPMELEAQVLAVATALENVHAELLSSEMQYRLKHTDALSYLRSLMSGDDHGPFFTAYVEFCERDDRCGRFKLADILVQPLQRLTRYPLLVRGVLNAFSGGTETEGSHALQAVLQKFEKAIDAHNNIVKENDNCVKLQNIQKRLQWQSLAEMNPKEYVPENLKEYLQDNFTIELEDDQHKLDIQGEKRKFIYEGFLRVIGRKGLVSETLFAYLFGSILILTKPNSKKRSDPDSKMVFIRSYSLRELSVKDVSDTDTHKNMFVLLFLDGFNQPYEFKTLQVEKEFMKKDWLCHLSNGIQRTNSRNYTIPAEPVVNRKVRLTSSRQPLRSGKRTDGSTPVIPSMKSPTGFWGLDTLSTKSPRPRRILPDSPSDKAKRTIKRTSSLPKSKTSTPKNILALEWDDLGTDLKGSGGFRKRAASSESLPTLQIEDSQVENSTPLPNLTRVLSFNDGKEKMPRARSEPPPMVHFSTTAWDSEDEEASCEMVHSIKRLPAPEQKENATMIALPILNALPVVNSDEGFACDAVASPQDRERLTPKPPSVLVNDDQMGVQEVSPNLRPRSRGARRIVSLQRQGRVSERKHLPSIRGKFGSSPPAGTGPQPTETFPVEEPIDIEDIVIHVPTPPQALTETPKRRHSTLL